jgi:glycosyltransferase involved in cell wall biosynthesis
MLKSSWQAIKIKNIDICFATSTPLTVGLTALLLKRLRKIPFVFEVRDLWPEFPIQMGAIKSKILQKISYYIENSIYNNSESIVALSPGMRNGIIKYQFDKKISVIPNAADLDLFYPHQNNSTIANEYQLSGKFNIVHFGSMGLANGLEYIINSAELAHKMNNQKLQFIFIGTGKTENNLKKNVHEKNLSNVKFLGHLSKHIVSEIVNICDISIISFLDLPILYTNSPNKLFDSLAAGKVCFVNSNGWTRKLLEENECGFFVDPNDPNDFLTKIEIIKNNSSLRRKMEINARKLAESEFDRKLLAKMVMNQLEDSL